MDTHMENILECSHVVKKYGSILALSGLDLCLPKGRIIGLLGPNGSGKTTLIKLIAGLLQPNDGTITVNGTPVGEKTKAMVSYLPERNYIPRHLKVSQIIDYFADFYKDFRRDRACDMLQSLNINPNSKIKTLSKGTLEKVQLILVMSREAQLYLLDEPIAGVDPAARDYILNTIISNYNPSASVIISTHLISDIENILDDVVMIRNGALVLAGNADDIRADKGMSIDELFREVFRC